jgi:hypothetical protein
MPPGTSVVQPAARRAGGFTLDEPAPTPPGQGTEVLRAAAICAPGFVAPRSPTAARGAAANGRADARTAGALLRSAARSDSRTRPGKRVQAVGVRLLERGFWQGFPGGG